MFTAACARSQPLGHWDVTNMWDQGGSRVVNLLACSVRQGPAASGRVMGGDIAIIARRARWTVLCTRKHLPPAAGRAR